MTLPSDPPVAGPSATPAHLLALAARFGYPAARLAVIGQQGGFGGCFIVRLDTDAARYCLRGWPAAVPIERVRFLQAVVRHAAAHGCDLLPQPLATPAGESIFVAEGRTWELTTWASGSADFERQPSAARLAAAAEAVAAFHRALAGFPSQEDWLPYDPAALVATIRAGLDDLAPQLNIDQREAAPAHALFQALGSACQTIEAALAQHGPTLTDRSALAHGDIDPEHIFFAGDRVTGLIDFDQTGFRPQALDVAMLLDRFAGWQPAATDSVLDGYQALQPLADTTLAALPALATLAIAGWAWEAVEARYRLGADFGVYREDFAARAARYARRLAAVPARLPV